jgi:hypothetical protein
MNITAIAVGSTYLSLPEQALWISDQSPESLSIKAPVFQVELQIGGINTCRRLIGKESE